MSDVIAHFEQIIQDTPEDNSTATETMDRQLDSTEPEAKKIRPGPLREFNCGPEQPKQNQVADNQQQADTDVAPDDSDPRFFDTGAAHWNRNEGRFFEVIATAEPGTLANALPVSPFLNLDEQRDNQPTGETTSSIDIGEPRHGRRVVDENA